MSIIKIITISTIIFKSFIAIKLKSIINTITIIIKSKYLILINIIARIIDATVIFLLKY